MNKDISKKSDTLRMFGRMVKLVSSIKPIYMPLAIVNNLINAVTVYLATVYGAKIIDLLVAGESEADILSVVYMLVGINVPLLLIKTAIDKVLIIQRRYINETLRMRISRKSLTMDYEILEKRETLDKIEKASEGMNSHGDITHYCQTISDAFGDITSIVNAIIILVGFFKVVDGDYGSSKLANYANSYWSGITMCALLLLIFVINYLTFKKMNKLQYYFFEDNVRGNREFSYFFGFMYNYSIGKDVRIYNMRKFILDKMNFRKNRLEKETKKIVHKSALLSNFLTTIGYIFLLACYAFVGMKAVYGIITIGALSMYTNALAIFKQGITNIQWKVSTLGIQTKYLSNFWEYLSIENRKYDGTLPIEKRLDNDYELEFKNVSFHYPNSEEMILKNVSIRLKIGRKMAIVGKNGAGKSTFIKLLCRLYDPTEGEILLNGIDIRKYNYDEYRDIFSVVFQDFQLFSFPIIQNVAAGINADRDKVTKCIEQAGLGERTREMEKGIDTTIYKQDENDGIEISGGEAQKIAIARALYKDAPVVILDEPTSALDPVSELEIYERFDEMVNEKTAIYISHRMSSCRFCENIVVFDDGHIVQYGSHDNLVADKDGLYYELWSAQAQYYK